MTLDEIKREIENRIKELEVMVSAFEKEHPTMVFLEGGGHLRRRKTKEEMELLKLEMTLQQLSD
jgi:hypothetical protein